MCSIRRFLMTAAPQNCLTSRMHVASTEQPNGHSISFDGPSLATSGPVAERIAIARSRHLGVLPNERRGGASVPTNAGPIRQVS
jgi:hypothetical protein